MASLFGVERRWLPGWARGSITKALFAPGSIAVSIKPVDVFPDHSCRTGNIGRIVTATASAVDVTNDRNAGTRVIRVARCILLFRQMRRIPTDEKQRSASPPGAFGESVERGEHVRRTPHSVARSTGRLDEDARLGERVEVAVSVGGLDSQLLRQ